jgi:aminopeptidase YwaD
MLVRGSSSADVEAELVWIGSGSSEEIDRVEVEGKIVVSEGSLRNAYNYGCNEKGALGIVAISDSRPNFDPFQIPWSQLGGWRDTTEITKFAFYLPFREGYYLKKRLLRGEKITVHAQVKTTKEPYDLQDVVCHIPGTDPQAGEIILCAHLFEGITKQGANDNKSGSAGILEVARVLHTLIEEGRIPQPKRTIRFLWGPEFSGTGPWVKANKDLMEMTLCNINMDMVGEWLTKNKAHAQFMRTTYGNPHYINDVMENYYRFVGEGSREKLQNRSSVYPIAHRIVAPTGSDEPFYYSIETHYGASDHEVFNDWSVRVPGIMMIVWPDQWYHTSGDRVDKADPTQMKRIVVIGAAAAYTIAKADDDMANKIAGEICSNGSRRLGHQLAVGLEGLNQANAETFSEAYKMAKLQLETAIANEKATLESVLELVKDKKKVDGYVSKMKAVIDQIGKSHIAVIETHTGIIANRLKIAPVKIQLSELEIKASKMMPKPTSKVKEKGYGGYREYLDNIKDEDRKKYPYSRRDIASTSELQLLIDGKRSILDIKNYLDVQYPRKSDLQGVMNYIEILKLAGLVEM